jgi:RHS repeat-associated protein
MTGTLAGFVPPTAVPSLSYDGANRLTGWGGKSISYDANGNITNFGSATYTWNSRNQLTATSNGAATFGYDAFGRRVSATVSGVTTSNLYDGQNPAMIASSQMLAGAGLDEIYAQISSGGTTSYLRDGLNSTVALTNGSAATTANYSYSPYGDSAGTGTAATPLQYTGRENDGATGLYYYRARYYSPAMGRFISEDPIGLAGGTNFYAYANGNPINGRDPLGLFDWPSLPQSIVDTSAGFGDGVSRALTLGIISTSNVRAALGIDGGVNMCSADYKTARYEGLAWGAATFIVGGLNGGPVFYSGVLPADAAAVGSTMSQTPIGAILSAANVQNPVVLNVASAIYAANMSGTATVVVGAGGATGAYYAVEQTILAMRGIPIIYVTR